VEQRNLGTTGLTVSALGFGCGSVGGLMVRGDPAEQTRTVARALDAGVTYFDTASMYGNGRSEENLGRVLRGLNAWGRVAVGTKVRLADEDRGDLRGAVRRSAEASLRRLGHDSVDLLQLHNAITADAGERGVDQHEATGEVLVGLRDVVAAGLARHIGFTGLGDSGALAAVIRTGGYETMQSYFNVLNPSAGFAGAAGGAQDFAGLIDAAAGAGLGVIAIRVMAGGALSPDETPPPNASQGGPALTGGGDFAEDRERAGRLASLIGNLGLEGPLELAVRFALAKPGVSTALVGYSNMGQLKDALRWAERGPLPADAVARVVELAGGARRA
jgi:aryl-alcohol dehydrogenase-like predicted oxidoreductase